MPIVRRAPGSHTGTIPTDEPPDEKRRTLILIPVRNESAQIANIVAGCLDAGFTPWVLDDGSRDATPSLAQQAGARVLNLPPRGKTAALRQALRQIPDDIDWLFLMDGDGQHRPCDLAKFWQLRHHRDLIIGNRWADASQMPWERRLVNRLMTWLLNRLSGGTAPDTQCGFRLVRRSLIRDWFPRGNHYEFETELYLHAIRQQARIESTPLQALYADEKSKIFWPRDTWRFIRCLTQSSN
jgi:glycosyltransferase involved in cell wall biosynthesis